MTVAFAALCATAVGAALGSSDARAGESLTQAMTSAYANNPRLDAERARLRSTDEGVPQARSGWAPRVSADARYGYSEDKTKPTSTADGTSRPGSFGVTLTQPVFDGFQTRNTVKRAEARVRAGRAQLRATEADVLLAAVTAYMDVVRDSELLRLNKTNVKALRGELRAARERRAVREVTRTDVAQAQARLARGQSALDEVRADLRASQAEYRRLVGHAPKGVRMPPVSMRLVPRSLKTAVDFALREAPRVHIALYQEQEARHEVDRITGELLPRVQLDARYEENHDTSRTVQRQTEASIFGRLTVPLFTGGETRARVRAAKHQHVGRLQDIEEARRLVRSRVAASWSALRANRSRIRSDEIQVRASATALEGVRAEQQVGARTLLDVLNAEQELLEARAGLVRTKRNTIVAQYRLLAEIGRLDAEMLSLPTAIYDPQAHYEDAKSKWLDVSITQPDPPTPEEVEAGERRAAWKLKAEVPPQLPPDLRTETTSDGRHVIDPETHPEPPPLRRQAVRVYEPAPVTTGAIKPRPAARPTTRSARPALRLRGAKSLTPTGLTFPGDTPLAPPARVHSGVALRPSAAPAATVHLRKLSPDLGRMRGKTFAD
ncbi:MAG: TolC family outer membrane protein [Pseudomonadota bacterium]